MPWLARRIRNVNSEQGAVGWLIVGIIIGVVLVIWLIIQLLQALF